MVIKQSAGGLFVIFLLLGVLRPAFKALASADKRLLSAMENNTQGKVKVEQKVDTPEARIAAAKNFAQSNPKGVAEVLKTWVDGG